GRFRRQPAEDLPFSLAVRLFPDRRWRGWLPQGAACVDPSVPSFPGLTRGPNRTLRALLHAHLGGRIKSGHDGTGRIAIASCPAIWGWSDLPPNRHPFIFATTSAAAPLTPVSKNLCPVLSARA